VTANQTRLTSQLLGEPLVGPDRRLTPRWYVYFRDQAQAQLQGPTRLFTTQPTDPVNASIGVTSLEAGTLPNGDYRVTVYARITTAAGVSSSLDTVIGWTDNGQSCTKRASDVQLDWPITGNAVTATASFSVSFKSSQNPATPITFQFDYVSNPASAMFYDYFVVLELLGITA